jgi:hypothetical protein
VTRSGRDGTGHTLTDIRTCAIARTRDHLRPMIEPSDDTLRRWLLHSLPQQEAARLEERLLLDEDFAAHLRAVETDLLDDYAHDRLSEADLYAVANHLVATPSDRARLRIAAALARIGGESAQPRGARAVRHDAAPAPARWSRRGRHAAVGGLLASACAILIAIGLSRHAEIEQATTAEATTTITLLADQQRGARTAETRIPHAAANVRLQVEVGYSEAQARYTLRISDGARSVFTANNLVPREAGPYHFIEVVLSARMLADGAYRVHVTAQGTSAGDAVWPIRTHTD